MRKDIYDLARLAGAFRALHLRCRQQACESIAAGDSVEQAAPHCKNPSRSPDPSTLRRWAQRRLLSVCCWVKAGAVGLKLHGHPPSLPGISTQAAVFCRSRQEVRESPGARRFETADSACWIICRNMIGSPCGRSAAADGWGCARCMRIINPASWSIPTKSLFYCYGCGRGGDVIRFAEIYHEAKFPQAVALLLQWRGLAPYCRAPRSSIAFSFNDTARRSSIFINAESARRKSSITCVSAMRLAHACAVG